MEIEELKKKIIRKINKLNNEWLDEKQRHNPALARKFRNQIEALEWVLEQIKKKKE